MELCLGTVQFGMNYGVYNTPPKEAQYCINCLDYATQNGINAIDTAAAYGYAEEIVGQFLNRKTISRNDLYLSTKILPNILDDYKEEKYAVIIREKLKDSLKRLHTDYVDVLYFHSSRYAFQPAMLEAISAVQKEGLARHVGVSVYYPNEALECFSNPNIDSIQTPYSVFDHRMKEENVFRRGHSAGFNIDVRTVFLKGLIRLKPDEIPQNLSKAKPILQRLDKICEDTGFSRIEIAMGYVKREKMVNHLVFGVRTLEQLKEDIESFNKDIPEELYIEIDRQFSKIPADLIIPSLWAK